jgi:hypothetical protein
MILGFTGLILLWGVYKDGGGGRIRTFEVCDGRFTVCSLWPLGNPTMVFMVLQIVVPVLSGRNLAGFLAASSLLAERRWWWGKDSNLRSL